MNFYQNNLNNGSSNMYIYQYMNLLNQTNQNNPNIQNNNFYQYYNNSNNIQQNVNFDIGDYTNNYLNK